MRADPPSLVARAMRLGGVLDQPEAVAAGDVEQRIEVGWLTIEVGRQKRLGARGDCRLDPRRIEVEGRRIGLDQHRGRADHRDGKQGGDIAVAGDDHLIARADVERPQGEVERVEPVADADAMAGPAIGGEFGFERLDLGAADIPARAEHAQHRSVDLRLKLAIGRAEIEEFYAAHRAAPTAARNWS